MLELYLCNILITINEFIIARNAKNTIHIKNKTNGKVYLSVCSGAEKRI